jgi:hypothetical protein
MSGNDCRQHFNECFVIALNLCAAVLYVSHRGADSNNILAHPANDETPSQPRPVRQDRIWL